MEGAAEGGAAAPAAEGGAAAPAVESAPVADVQPNVTSTADIGVASQINAEAPAPHWTESLDPDMQNYIKTKGFQEPADVLKSYRNFEKLQGAPQERVLKLPNEADSPDWEGVYTKLGKPATPAGYELDMGVDGTDAEGKWVSDTFHSLNLTKEQGQQLMTRMAEYDAQQQETQQVEYNAKIDAEVNDLKKEQGMKYDTFISTAKKAARAFKIPDAALDSLEKSMGFKATMTFLNDLGTKVGEAAYHSSEAVSNSFGETMVLNPEQAKAKINELKKDGAWTSAWEAGDTKKREQLARLHQMAYPD